LALWALGCGGSTSRDTSIRPPAFVAVGAQGAILSSAHGAVWTRESSGVSARLNSIAAREGLLVAVGAGGTILTSVHAGSWTKRSSGTEVDLTHVIFNGEQFVAVGGGYAAQATCLTSSDGATWTALEPPPKYSFHAVAVAGGIIFAAAETQSTTIPMALDNVVLEYVLPSTSNNRGSWRDRSLPRFSDSLQLGPETLTVGSWSGESTVSRSTDGQHWTTQVLPGNDARAIATSGSDLVIVGGRSVFSSATGTDWTEPRTALAAGWLSAVTHGGSTFVAVGSGGAILTSADGSAWTTRDAAHTSDLADVVYQ
jgi:hypothetical protein